MRRIDLLGVDDVPEGTMKMAWVDGTDQVLVINSNDELYAVQGVCTHEYFLFFLPYLAGERTPHADPNARGAFIGLTLKHSRGHLARAIMEGVTYSLRDCLAIIEEQGVAVKQVRASGGGAKSPFWRQMQANVFDKTVVTMAADEGPGYGVALLAAVGAGEFKNVPEACEATVKTTSQTKPSAVSRRVYDKGFPEYQQLYRSLHEDFKIIAKLE